MVVALRGVFSQLRLSVVSVPNANVVGQGSGDPFCFVRFMGSVLRSPFADRVGQEAGFGQGLPCSQAAHPLALPVGLFGLAFFWRFRLAVWPFFRPKSLWCRRS